MTDGERPEEIPGIGEYIDSLSRALSPQEESEDHE
jgi:hypothetical protein